MSDKPPGRITNTGIDSESARWWQQRYPLFLGWWPELAWLLFVSMAAALIFTVIQPFGLSHLDRHAAQHFLLLVTAGLILLSVLTQVVLPALLNERWEADWSVGKALSYQIANLLLLAMLIYLLALWHGYAHFEAVSILQFLLITLLVGSVPVALTIVVKQNALMRASLRQQQQLAEPATSVAGPSMAATQPLNLISDTEETLTIHEADIAYVRAQQNYCELVTRNGHHLLRISLQALSKQLQATAIIRCHRSYLVNLNWIRKIDGNAQGYQLRLRETNETVPVSRSYLPLFNEQWQQRTNNQAKQG